MSSAREEERERENRIRERVSALPDDLRRQFYHRFNRLLKDPDSYAVLNYLFISGLHHFYLRRWVRGIFNLLVFVFSVTLIFSGEIIAGLLVLLVISVLELPALFRSQVIVQRYNNDVSESLLKQLES